MNELLIFGEIPFEQGMPNSPLKVRQQLNRMDFSVNPSLLVRINSEGGDVDNGFAIYDALRELSENGINITTQIDGRCASIATVIFMAGDVRIGNQYFEPFVHSASWDGSITQHNASSVGGILKTTDERIATLYASVTKQPKTIFLEMMKNETSISAKTALEMNFFHQIKKTNKPKNMTFSQQIKNLLSPIFGIKNFKMYTATQELLETDTDAPTIAIGDKATINGSPATGEILMESGQTFVFDDSGILTEIREPEDAEGPTDKEEPTEVQTSITEIANALKKVHEDFALITADNQELKVSVEAISNKLVDANKIINSIKNLRGEGVDDPKTDEPKPAKSALDKYRK